MRIALLHSFAPSRKEPLAALLEQIHAAFAASGLAEPAVTFTLADTSAAGFVSSVDRVLKRHPALERFLATGSALPGVPSVRRLTNASGTPAAGESVDFATLLAIAAGVPKSFPFHSVIVQFRSPAFDADGLAIEDSSGAPPIAPGVLVGDSWWVSGRLRSLSAVAVVGADPAGRPLPMASAAAAVVASCGKPTSISQVPLADGGTPDGVKPMAASPAVKSAVEAIVADFRRRFDDVLDRARLPHVLPPPTEALQATPLGESAGSKKPVLLRAFKPLGYDCRYASGEYTLHRQSDADVAVDISLDVGTWSRTLHASCSVSGPDFAAVLPLAITQGMSPGSGYKIGDGDRWRQIVDNLAALVAELDRSFVPAIEAATAASPGKRDGMR